MSLENILGLILYITPGFISMEVYHYFYPVRERSDFIQTVSSIIWGVIVTAIVRGIDSVFLDNMLHSDKNKVPSLLFILILFIAGALMGCFLLFINRIRLRISQKWPKFKKIAPALPSAWAGITKSTNEDWAIVFLDDGAIYQGWIKYYTFDPNAENHDFILSHAKRVEENLNVKYEIDGIGVYMNTKNIKRIEFIKGETESIQ